MRQQKLRFMKINACLSFYEERDLCVFSRELSTESGSSACIACFVLKLISPTNMLAARLIYDRFRNELWILTNVTRGLITFWRSTVTSVNDFQIYQETVMIGLIIFQSILHYVVAPEGMCQNLNEIYESSVKSIISTTTCRRRVSNEEKFSWKVAFNYKMFRTTCSFII